MALEIEHKFLLRNDDWRTQVSHSVLYQQGYLSSGALSSIRVRTSATEAWLNIKSATPGSLRQEYEYVIPLEDAQQLLATLCLPSIIVKTRHFIPQGSHTWEIDEFAGDNQGLIVAEIELASVDTSFVKPAWLGEEVTHDLRYYNNSLAQKPYSQW